MGFYGKTNFNISSSDYPVSWIPPIIWRPYLQRIQRKLISFIDYLLSLIKRRVDGCFYHEIITWSMFVLYGSVVMSCLPNAIKRKFSYLHSLQGWKILIYSYFLLSAFIWTFLYLLVSKFFWCVLLKVECFPSLLLQLFIVEFCLLSYVI